MRFTSVTFLLAIAVVDANPILDDKNVGNAGVDTEATLRAGQVVGELARRKDWICDPDSQACGTGDPNEAHYCRPNKCTGWHGCIPYTTASGQRYAWCS